MSFLEYYVIDTGVDSNSQGDIRVKKSWRITGTSKIAIDFVIIFYLRELTT